MKEAEGEAKGKASGGRWLVGSTECNVSVAQDCGTLLRADFEHDVQGQHNKNSPFFEGLTV